MVVPDDVPAALDAVATDGIRTSGHRLHEGITIRDLIRIDRGRAVLDDGIQGADVVVHRHCLHGEELRKKQMQNLTDELTDDALGHF